jgi:hypothetical protein
MSTKPPQIKTINDSLTTINKWAHTARRDHFTIGYTYYVLLVERSMDADGGNGAIRHIEPFTSRQEAARAVRKCRKVAAMFDFDLFIAERSI